MKKKAFLLLILSTLLIVVLATGLAACNDDEGCSHDEKFLVEVELEPTCKARGKALYECYNCHAQFEEELPVNPQGHDWDEASEVREEFCDKPGSLTHTCLICHETITETLEATGHDIKSVVMEKETCTTPGKVKYTCTKCDYNEIKTVPATGHDPGEMIVIEEATCVKPGRKESRCENCGELCGTAAIPATGHTEAQPVVTKPANCVDKGEKTVNCAVCGEFIRKIEIAPLGHKPVDISPEEAPTCQKQGHTAGSMCDVCGVHLVEQQPIDTVDHSYKEGKCIWCEDEKICKATFKAYGELVEEKTFTVSTANDVVAPAIPAKTGYTNLRWEQYTLTYEDVTINALYDLEQYPITYNETYGAQNSNPQSYNIESGELTLQPIERLGYEFVGWFVGEDKKESVAEGAYGALELTAKWNKLVYQIKYEGCEGVDTSKFPTSFSIDSEEITLPKAERAGYDFGGWLEKGEAADKIETGSHEDKTFVAQFTPHEYDITYEDTYFAKNPNPQSYNIESGEIKLENIERPGYNFMGWLEGGQKKDKIESGTYGERTFTAQWEKAVYHITYTGCDGIDTSEFPSEFSIDSSAIELPKIERVGYKFEGWMANGEIKTHIATGSYGDITLTAKFTPYKYPVSLDALGGSLSARGDMVSYGERFTLEVPTRKGYEFLGWFDGLGDDADQLTDNKGVSFDKYERTEGLKVYARWQICTYTVTFDTGDGSDIDPQTYEYNQRFVLPEEPKQKNAFFAGWYDESGTVEYTSNSFITDNVTMHAKWVESVDISTPEDLKKIVEYPDKNYHLENDIDMRGEIWTPIPEFSGTFNGRGYKIYNFLLSSTSPGENFGLIAVNNGTIKDLVISDFTFNVKTSNTINAGVLVGKNSETGIIQNVKATRSEEMTKLKFELESSGFSTPAAACIVGRNNGKVLYCSTENLEFEFTGDLTSGSDSMTLYCAFIVGSNSGHIANCTSTGEINYDSYAGNKNYYTFGHVYGNVGFIVGSNAKSGTVEECNANGDMHLTPSGSGYSCGRVAILVGSNNGLVCNSFSAGKITGGLNSDNCMGGLIGCNETGARVESCYSSAIIDTPYGNYIGGLVGYNYSVIQNCYATGNVKTSANANIGGLVGYNRSTGTVTKCFAINDVTIAGTSGTAGYLVGKNDGVLSGSYYTQGSVVTVNNQHIENPADFDLISSVSITRLWTEDFLYDVLYWDQAGWTFLVDENPRLDWEFTAGHNFIIEEIKPDCTHGGYTMYSCVDCGTIFVKDYVEPNGHNYRVESTVPAGCTTEGYTLKKCNVCQFELRDDIVEPTGHPKEKLQLKDQQEGRATCTEDGILVYHCEACSNDITVPEAALGHKGSLLRHETDATCSQEGKDIYHCDTCSQDYDVILPRTEHTFVDVEYLAPTCGIVMTGDGQIDREKCEPKDGHQAGSKCSECGFVQYGCQVIPAHVFEHKSYEKAPTCTAEGVEILVCRDCQYEYTDDHAPMIAHKDGNGDFQCDVCKNLMFTDAQLSSFTHIKDVAGLLSIMNNPNSNYWLDNDITIGADVVWTPIGTQKMPFKGIFFGANHKISGLNFDIQDSTAATAYGLFGYNSGKILNLKLSGVTLNILNSDQVVFGGIAAYNRGEVRNCELVDANKIFVGVELVVTTYKRQELRMSVGNTIGGLVGINQGPTSLIEDCTVSGTLNVEFSNISSVKAAKASATLWSLIFETCATTEQRVTFGGLVGINEGKVNQCSVKGQTEFGMNIFAELTFMRGEAYATSHLYCGSFVGYNSGTVTACSAKAANSNYNQKVLSDRRSGLLYTVQFALYNYSMSDGVANIEGGADKFATFECEEL